MEYLDRILRRPQGAEILGISLPSFDRVAREKDFPSKVRIAPGVVGWFESELLAFARRRQEGRVA